jgi:FeS assembly SUF system regulator
MLRIAKLTDYATVLLALLARSSDSQQSAAELAARARLEVTTVSKVLKQLSQAGLVEARRGASGGYRLAKAPQAISVADVIVAMEGPIGLTECQLHTGLCSHETHCGVRNIWRKIGLAVETALRSVTVADLTASSGAARTPARPIPTRIKEVQP